MLSRVTLKIDGGCSRRSGDDLTLVYAYGKLILMIALLLLILFVVPDYGQATTPNKILRVGYLAKINAKPPRQGHIISGAMTYAIQEVKSNQLLPDNYELDFVYNDTKGDTLLGTESVVQMSWDGIIAFFGPEESCEVEATVSASLNLPMIAYKCSDSADKNISAKDYRPYFARMYPPNTKVVRSVIELLRYYNWFKFSIIHDIEDTYAILMKSLKEEIDKQFTIMHIKNFDDCCAKPNRPKKCCQEFFPKIVSETYQETRVYVFLGNKKAMCKFLKVLLIRNLLENGEYVVIYIDLDDYSITKAHEYVTQTPYFCSLKAAQSLLVIVATPPGGNKYKEFENKVREFNKQEPFKFRTKPFEDYQAYITPYASYLYDAVMLYAKALSEALRNNTDPRNGTEIMKIFKKQGQYTSVTGASMKINEDGDIEGNYTVLSVQIIPVNQSALFKSSKEDPMPTHCMLPVGSFYYTEGTDSNTTRLRFKLEREIIWVNNKPPLAEPHCGFDGRICRPASDSSKEITAAVLGAIFVVTVFSTIMVYKNWKYEQGIDGLLWKIDIRDIETCGFGGIVCSSSRMSLASHLSLESKIIGQIFTHTAMFKGTLIALKQLRFTKKIVDISRKTKKEMKMIREMHNDNINQFIGACVNPNSVCIVTEYCSKGSLQDILENDDLKLDNMFIASLVFDLIKGMIFLHDSDIKVHGNLKSSNCVISSRWVLQITDFGMHELRASAETGSVAEHQYYRNLLWKAPEFLRYPSVNPFGTQRGDVYAFGIILHEIIGRQGPFGVSELTPKEIICLVKENPDDEEPFRPPTEYLECQDYVLNTMRDAWHERPEMRPDFHHIKERLRKMRQGMKVNIMDNMMSMMEKYANNLEELVDERTVQLVEEKKKTEALLHRMLPKSVANQLMRGEAVIPEAFDAVTIYFSDIVGFTEMSASSTPMEVVTFLNDLYTVFDDIIGHYNVYKVETIGDAYMVVSGLPIRNEDNHAGEIAFMALELLDSILNYKIRHKSNEALKLRIGIHTGPVVAGVVGLTMPRYCLFGDTVNTASRMESNGEALKIHISPQCKEYLDRLGGYYTVDRGLLKIKGKGEMRTYWLLGHSKGLKKHPNTTLDHVPPQPLFGAHRDEHRRKSPKLSDLSRRGSIAIRRNSSLANCTEDINGSPGMPVFLRLSQDSPRSPKRLSSQAGRESRLLKVRDSDTGSWYGSTASSCSELHNALNFDFVERRGANGVDGTQSPSSSMKPKLESICSEDCELCAGNPDYNCQCRVEGEESKNGLIHLDESLRPLLSTGDVKVDLILPKDLEKETLKPPVLRLPSKPWRSCDEIALPKGSRSSLKDFFSGILGTKAQEQSEIKRGNNSTAVRQIHENCKEESLV